MKKLRYSVCVWGGDFLDSHSKLARKAGPRPSPLAAVLVVASPAAQSVPPDQAAGEEPTPLLGMEQDWNRPFVSVNSKPVLCLSWGPEGSSA